MSRMFTVNCTEQVGLQCALCRLKYIVPDIVIKNVLAKHVPSHAILLENKCCEKKYVLSHEACEHGCYDCEGSQLQLHAI